jgi:[NiFe] hydrogenase assembly HybE family chaperone
MNRVIDRLVRAYRHIGDERIIGLPIYHDKLSVEAVGFQVWEGGLVGVLIAPWFMNLVLLPGDADEWAHLRAGSEADWEFPSGTYQFRVSVIEEVGVHLSAVLFSNMKAFPDQDIARAVAREIMARIFHEGGGLDGTGSDSALAEEGVLSKPMSRRRLLRGFVAVADSKR